jgi:hypothetical protein
VALAPLSFPILKSEAFLTKDHQNKFLYQLPESHETLYLANIALNQKNRNETICSFFYIHVS